MKRQRMPNKKMSVGFNNREMAVFVRCAQSTMKISILLKLTVLCTSQISLKQASIIIQYTFSSWQNTILKPHTFVYYCGAIKDCDQSNLFSVT